MPLDKRNYLAFGETPIYFSKKDKKRVESMRGSLTLLSTVCPDYPCLGKKYTFQGELGKGVSLTARQHLEIVPALIKSLAANAEINWLILVADLPELTEGQKEFYERVAGSREEYLQRCHDSAKAIKICSNGYSRVETFSEFYGAQGIDYLAIQEKVAGNISQKAGDPDFSSKFTSFVACRMALAEKFRGRRLSLDEHKAAAAHGMSLYITHGSLLRKVFEGKNLVVINHFTPNLQNFFLCQFVDDSEHLQNSPKFPVGILDSDLY